VPLQAPTGAIVRRTTLEAMKRWVFNVMPLKLDNSLSKETQVKIYEDTAADRLAVGAVPREVSFRTQVYRQSFRRYGLAGSKWDINLMHAEGQQELAMQIKQINEGVFTAIVQDAISTILRSDVYFRDWAKKAYWSRMTIDAWYDEQVNNWNMLAMQSKGMEYFCAKVDHIQAQYQGTSNTLIIPVQSVIYNQQVKKENMHYYLIGDNSSGFNNKYSSLEPLTTIKGNKVYVLTPFQTSNEKVYDPLLRRNVQIGEYHIIANRHMYQNPQLYSTNDLSIAVYDEDEDVNKRIDMYTALDNCGFFDTEGYVLPPDRSLGGSTKQAFGTGKPEDLERDFLSKPDGVTPHGRTPIRLMGEIGLVESAWFRHFSEVFLAQVAKKHYKGGVGQLAQTLLRGETLLKKLAAAPFDMTAFKTFVATNYSGPSSVVLPPSDRVVQANITLRQLANKSGSSFYEINAPRMFGMGNLQALEELARVNDVSVISESDREDARNYVETVNIIVRELQQALPLSNITDARLTPLAIRMASAAHAFFVNCVQNNTCYVWIDTASSIVNDTSASDGSLEGLLTVNVSVSGANLDVLYGAERDRQQDANDDIARSTGGFKDTLKGKLWSFGAV
jgi:hypothetical protein